MTEMPPPCPGECNTIIITDVRVKPGRVADQVAAYVRLTLVGLFVVCDIKVVRGKHGLFVSMPSVPAKRSFVCACGIRSELRARFCRACGVPLSDAAEDPTPSARYQDVVFATNENARAVIVQAIKSACTQAGVTGYWRE